MKLLTKSDVVLAKTKEQKQILDEAAKLERRVSSLREIAAQEETSLQNFRKKTITQIQEDIRQENKVLEGLKKEVFQLQQKLAGVLFPLDSEWAKLTEAQNDLRVSKQLLEERVTQIKKKELDAQDVLDENLLEMERVKQAHERANELLEHADEKNTQAIKFMNEAERIKIESDQLVKKRQEEYKKRSKELEEKDLELKLQLAKVSLKEKELQNREIKLQDRIGMFERTLQRNNL